VNGNVKLRRAAARSGEWAQHFSNAFCFPEIVFFVYMIVIDVDCHTQRLFEVLFILLRNCIGLFRSFSRFYDALLVI